MVSAVKSVTNVCKLLQLLASPDPLDYRPQMNIPSTASVRQSEISRNTSNLFCFVNGWKKREKKDKRTGEARRGRKGACQNQICPRVPKYQ